VDRNLTVEYRPVEELIPYARNARTHSDEQVAQIAASICEAYVVSQKAEGWLLVPDRYDDGGFSGGTLERPALQEIASMINVRVLVEVRPVGSIAT
jgi:DNA invertase Pin-like site-specific DNA recombinase